MPRTYNYIRLYFCDRQVLDMLFYRKGGDKIIQDEIIKLIQDEIIKQTEVKSMIVQTEPVNPIQQIFQLLHLPQVDSEQILIINNTTWKSYEFLLDNLGENFNFRISYLEGVLQLMLPSRRHEENKKLIAMLVETYLLELGIRFYPLGSTTLKSEMIARGKEPDECYCLETKKLIPDIAIEVILTSGGINSLEVYQGLGVPEVWLWENDQFAIYCLENEKYIKIERSLLLPDLDFNVLGNYIQSDEPFEAVMEFRERLSKGNHQPDI